MSSELSLWKLIEELVSIIRLYAQLLRVIADIEEKTGKSFDDILKTELKPEGLLELSRRLPPEAFANLMTALLRISALAMRVSDPLKLSVKEKREMVAELEDISRGLETVVEKLKGLKS